MRLGGGSCRVSANEYSWAHLMPWSPNKLSRSTQCCGSGSGRIRNFWPDPDLIQNRNKHFGFETGSEIKKKKELCIQAKIRWFHSIIHISVGHWINSYCITMIYSICHRQLSVESAAGDWPAKCRQSARRFLQSSELRLPHPLTRRRVCSPLLWFMGGIHTHCGRGGGGIPVPTREQTLWYSRYLPMYICTLCSPAWGRYTIHRKYAYMCEILIDRKFLAHFVCYEVTELMEGSLEDEAA